MRAILANVSDWLHKAEITIGDLGFFGFLAALGIGALMICGSIASGIFAVESRRQALCEGWQSRALPIGTIVENKLGDPMLIMGGGCSYRGLWYEVRFQSGHVGTIMPAELRTGVIE